MSKKYNVMKGARTIAQRRKYGGKGKHIHGGGWVRDKWHKGGNKQGKGK